MTGRRRLAATYGTVVVEHLNVAGMVRNRRVAGKRPPGTTPVDQIGTVPPQDGISDHTLTRAH